MDKISLNKVLPIVFREETNITSDIWLKDLSFEKNKTYLIEANSGTGKSSFCSFLYGNRKDYLGNIFFDAVDIKNIPFAQWDTIRRSQLSILFQELRLFPELTAMENILLKNNLTNLKSISQIEDLLDRLNLSNKRDSLASHLSWGQQQRIAIIRCLCQPFDFLLMDEPISHLDSDNSQLLADIIEEEIKERGSSVIVTSIGKHLPLQYSKTYLL